MHLTKNPRVRGETNGATNRRAQQKYTKTKESKGYTSANDAH